MTWRDLEAGAPDIARLAREQLGSRRVALLGTIRADGWPRISPVEPFFVVDELVFGLMPTPKLDDLRRDARCVLHSPIVDATGGEPEVKLSGRAVETRAEAIRRADGTWWAARTDDVAVTFALRIEEAVVIRWAPDFERMRVTRWRPDGSPVDRERSYP